MTSVNKNGLAYQMIVIIMFLIVFVGAIAATMSKSHRHCDHDHSGQHIVTGDEWETEVPYDEVSVKNTAPVESTR